MFIALLVCFSIRAEDRRTYFQVGSDICTPILVKCDNGKTYRVYSELMLNGFVQPRSATDCQGRSIVIPGSSYRSKSGEYHYRYYKFKTLYGSSGSSSSSGTYDRNGSYNRSTYNSAQAMGNALVHTIFGLGGGNTGDAYPALRAELGVSRTYGDFVRLRYSGHGFNMFGGVGKDFLFDSKRKDHILWHAGIGSYFAFGADSRNPLMDIGMALGFSNSCQNKGVDMTVDVDYTCWIGKWRRVGVFAGGAVGWGNFVETLDTNKENSVGGFAWNLKAGLTFRLASF